MGNRLDGDLVQKARIALLNHYSSKSTNQATIILTLVIALFAFIEASQFITFHSNLLRILWDSSLPTIWLFFIIRAVGRLIWWGELASNVMAVEMINETCANKIIEDRNKEVPKEKVRFKPTYLMRLDKASRLAPAESKLYNYLHYVTKRPCCYIIFSGILLVFLSYHKSQISISFLECILFWVIFAIGCLIVIYGCIYVLKDIAHFVKCALVRTEMYVDIKIHDVPAKLVKDFNEYVVKPHYSGGMSQALKDLMRKAIEKEKTKKE